MPHSILARNAMLDHYRTQVTHVGLLQAQAAITAVVGEADDETFTKTAHGLADGDLIVLSSKTGGAELIEGRPYFVRDQAANTFKLAHAPGGGSGEQAVVAFSTDVSAVTVTELAELSGGTYARQAIAYAAAAAGQIDDTNNGIDVPVPAGATVTHAGYWTAVSGGVLWTVTVQTPEGPYAANGFYRVTDSKQHLNATGAQ